MSVQKSNNVGKVMVIKVKGKKKVVFAIIVGILAILALAFAVFMVIIRKQMDKIPGMTAEDVLSYTLKDNKDAVISVGIIKNGESSFKVYGCDGKELEKELHTYEIGSLTKTFTGALIAKAQSEGLLDINDTIDKYLELPKDNKYPTIAALLTHTSGYSGFYMCLPMVRNFFFKSNDFCGVTDEMIYNKLKKLNLDKDEYKFEYSNYGYAVLGLVIEQVYKGEYTDIVNEFAKEIGLSATYVSDGNGDLSKYWEWEKGDAYISAGALYSNIEDMLKYAQLQLEEKDYFADTHEILRNAEGASDRYKGMGIRIDAECISWMYDSENDIIWHNGGTGNYNSYIGFRPATGEAVVILSNLSPNSRIPATVLGIKLLR